MSKNPDVKLYGYATSPFVRKVGTCLYYKQIDFEFVPVNPINPKESIGFSGGTQVPVLSIGEDWKIDSTPIALWLDEVFPERPLLPSDKEARAKQMEIEAWVSGTFLPSLFRMAIDAPDTLDFKFRAWRLAALVSSQSPMPEHVRHRWPDLLRMAPFIQAMKKDLNMDESAKEMQMRIGMELIGHIGEGPFIGGSEHPTLNDLTIVPQLLFPFMGGLIDHFPPAKVPPLKDWVARVCEHLPENPILIRDDFVVGTIKEALV